MTTKTDDHALAAAYSAACDRADKKAARALGVASDRHARALMAADAAYRARVEHIESAYRAAKAGIRESVEHIITNDPDAMAGLAARRRLLDAGVLRPETWGEMEREHHLKANPLSRGSA